MSEPLPLVNRFQRSRWSLTRSRIDAMKPGQELEFPPDQKNNAYTSVKRLNDAYDGRRKWNCTATLHGWCVVTALVEEE